MKEQKTKEKTVLIVGAKSCATCGQEFDVDSEHVKCPDDQTLLCPTVVQTDIGLRVGECLIESKIGEGSSGQVYIGINQNDEKFAVKLLKLNLLSDPVAVRRFQQEVEAISALVHPSIAAIHEFGVLPNGRPFVIMDYAGKTSLSDLLAEKGRLDPFQACRMFLQIVDALTAAHQAGILHRDIKPGNIMIDDHGNVKVVDFGIAKINGIETTSTLTRTGASVGTPAYMSPEQCLGQNLDYRSDIYSLGCLMYECLSGKSVFPSENAFLCMNQHASESAPPLSELVKTLPVFLSTAVMICLNKAPNLRFQTMAELKTVLQASSDGHVGTKLDALSIIARNKIRSTIHGGNQEGSGKTKQISLPAFLCLIALLVFLVCNQPPKPIPQDLPVAPVEQIQADEVPAEAETILVNGAKPDASDTPDIKTLKKQFADIEKEIARLEKANQLSDAQSMQKELLKYKSLFNDQYKPPAKRCSEVHSVAVRKGYGGISAFHDGNSVPGTVDVKVTESADPIILTLLAESPVIWRLHTNPGVKVPQVILSGPEPQSIEGLQSGATVVKNTGDLESSSQLFLSKGSAFGGTDHLKANDLANQAVNADFVTVQDFDAPRDEVTVGAANPSWRAQSVMWRMREFYKKCMFHKDSAIQVAMHQITFGGAWIDGDPMYDFKGSIGEFNPYGPKTSTLKKFDKMKYFNALSVKRSDGRKSWYLVGDGRGSENPVTIAEYDPQTDKLTPLMSAESKDAPVWFDYDGITYDTKRNRLVLLADNGPEVQLLLFDVATRKWSKMTVTLPYGEHLFGVSYCPEDGAIYGLGTRLLEHPYRSYLFKIVNGRLIKTTRLSSSDYYSLEAMISMTKTQMHSIGPYIVAVISGDMSGGMETPKPTSVIIDRATARVVFTGKMSPQKGK